MSITAALVKELRDRTGAGMMECKKALTETDGDIDQAIENLRKAGAAKADKKASRIAAEGIIAIEISADAKSGVILEVNSETDFVAKDDSFKTLVTKIASRILVSNPANVDELNSLALSDDDKTTVDEAREALIGKIGENIQVRRFMRFSTDHTLGMYQHGLKIGVVVEMKGGDIALAKDIAMHIAASRPLCINESQVPKDELEKEKIIFTAQAKESGKPDNIIEKMIAGKIKKFINEVTLLGQSFVKDPDTNIAKLLESKNAEVVSFICYEVGQGIEKKKENFAEEVMAQVKD